VTDEVILTFSEGFEFAYRETWTFIYRSWVVAALLLIPFLVETTCQFLIGNWTPYQLLRLNIGLTLLRLSAEIIVFFIFTRFIVFHGDLRTALRFGMNTFRTYGPFALTYILVGALIDFVAQSGWLLASTLIDITTLSIFALWAVSAPGGGKIVSPGACYRKGFLDLPWALAFWLVTTLPLGIILLILELIAPDADAAEWYYWFHYGLQALAVCAGTILAFAIVHVIARNSGLHFVKRSSR